MERLDNGVSRYIDSTQDTQPIADAIVYTGVSRQRTRAHHGLALPSGGFGDGNRESPATEAEKEPIRRFYLENVDGFDAYLRLQGENVVDIYNSPPTTKQPVDEDEATTKIKEALSGMRKIGLDRLPPEWMAQYQQTINMLSFRQAYNAFKEAKERGERVPFNRSTILRDIGGVEPKQPSLDKLAKRRDRLAELLSRILNAPVRRDEQGLREAYARYQEASRITGHPDEIAGLIQQEVLGHARQQYDALGKAAGINLRPLSDVNDEENFVRVYTESDDNAWTMWSMRGPDMRRKVGVNIHPRQLVMLDHGAIEGYTWHEKVMHQGSSYAQQLEIAAGNLDEIAARLFIPSSWHLKEEAIAMRANHLLTSEGHGLSLPGLLFQENYGMFVMARADALHDMYAYRLTAQQAAATYGQFNFLKPYENFLKDLENGSTNPFWIPYFEHYRRGEEAIMEYIDRTKADPFRGGRLRTLLTRPMTPEQFSRHIQVKI